MRKIITGIVVAAFLTACGSGISGKYGTDKDWAVYDFHSDGTVDQESMGVTARMKYKVDGKKIAVETPTDGTLIYQLSDDGSLKTPFGVLKKQ
ncbi:hypothetical protein AAKU67_003918 [Oxalobacteraceae bacterium GrIS 2.11]